MADSANISLSVLRDGQQARVTALHLTGGERILDLACGFGRHTLELARRGFQVVGVDITPDYIAFAREQAKREGLSAAFFCCRFAASSGGKAASGTSRLHGKSCPCRGI